MGRITDRGFGFIDIDGMEEVFFHSNDIVDDIDIRQMREGDKVLLDLVPSIKKRDRYDAKNVRPDDPDTKNREEVGRRPSPRRRRSPPRRGYSRGRSYSPRRRSRSRGYRGRY